MLLYTCYHLADMFLMRYSICMKLCYSTICLSIIICKFRCCAWHADIQIINIRKLKSQQQSWAVLLAPFLNLNISVHGFCFRRNISVTFFGGQYRVSLPFLLSIILFSGCSFHYFHHEKLANWALRVVFLFLITLDSTYLAQADVIWISNLFP